MANIQEVAEELCRLTTKEVNELSQVMKSEYGIEPAACIDKEIEKRRRIKECTSPKEYGMALMQRRQQKQARRRNK